MIVELSQTPPSSGELGLLMGTLCHQQGCATYLHRLRWVIYCSQEASEVWGLHRPLRTSWLTQATAIAPTSLAPTVDAGRQGNCIIEVGRRGVGDQLILHVPVPAAGQSAEVDGVMYPRARPDWTGG